MTKEHELEIKLIEAKLFMIICIEECYGFYPYTDKDGNPGYHHMAESFGERGFEILGINNFYILQSELDKMRRQLKYQRHLIYMEENPEYASKYDKECCDNCQWKFFKTKFKGELVLSDVCHKHSKVIKDLNANCNNYEPQWMRGM